MTPAPDHIAELALIAMSRMQRETLERWAIILATVDQHEQAEQLAQLARAPDSTRQEAA